MQLRRDPYAALPLGPHQRPHRLERDIPFGNPRKDKERQEREVRLWQGQGAVTHEPDEGQPRPLKEGANALAIPKAPCAPQQSPPEHQEDHTRFRAILHAMKAGKEVPSQPAKIGRGTGARSL